MTDECRAWFAEHTADIALEAVAPTQEQLLGVMAHTLCCALTEASTLATPHVRSVEILALDDEDRLVQWINEILYLAVVEGFVTGAAQITLLPVGALRAELRGEAEAHHRVVTEMKSATYHDLALGERDGRWFGRVIIDV